MVKSRVLKLEKVKWKQLSFIQHEDFKEWIDGGDKKLLNSILKYQFIDPFKVWENDGKLYCLDGRHRYLDLLAVEENGTPVPELLDATFIDCQNEKEAAELVLIYSSAYAKITQQGMYDFVSKFDIDIPDLKDVMNIPDFSMDRFEQTYDAYNINEDNGEDDAYFVNDDEEIKVQPGDLFQLNDHKIICGSFKDKETVDLLMGNEKARIINCDPPYNLPTGFFSGNKEHKDFAEGAGEMTDDEFASFLSLIMQRSVEYSVPGAIHYIFMDFRHQWHMCEAARRVYGSPVPKQTCVWYKDVFANGSFYRAQHELCFVLGNNEAKALWNKDLIDEGGCYKTEDELCFIFKNGDAAKHLSHLALKDRIRTNVWKYPSASSRANPDHQELKNHPTPKPTSMIADAILDTTNPGDIVIDWFHGSGTCIIACEKTKRKGRFTEIEPKYVQSEIIRYLNYCRKQNIEVNFTHLNGKLTSKDFVK